MEQKLGRGPAVLFSIMTAIAAYFLRLNQLENAYDETGYIVAGAEKGGFAWFCLAVLALFAAYSFFLRPRKKYPAIAVRGPVPLTLTLAAAAAMTVGCVAMAMELEQMSDLLLAAGGIVTAICWVVVGLDRYRGRQIPAALLMVPALYYAVELICNFRYWSRDPQILDYCYDLLALISVMCATYHLGGFCFDKGGRRICTFFCFSGIFFSAAALADGGLRSIALNGASILWLLVNLSALLRPARKRRTQDE